MPGGPPSVVVVGAGLAGLTAAYRLERAGARVVVVEAGDRIGGRLRSDVLEDVSFEPSCPLVPASAPVLFGLVAELGLSGSVRRERIEAALHLGRGRARLVRLRCDSGYAPRRALRARRLRALLEWFSPLLDPRVPERANRLDDRSVSAFARLYLGAAAVPKLYGPLLEAGFGLDADETSRLLLMLLMSPFGDVMLAHTSGLGALPDQIRRHLADVRTGARAVAVHATGRAVSLASGDEIETDAVVVATPAAEVRELVSSLCPAEELFFARSGSQPRLSVAVATDASPRTRPSVAWFSRGGALAAVCDLTPAASPAEVALHLLVARTSFARELWHDSDVNLCATLLRSAERVHPGLRRRVRALRVYRLPDAAPRFDVGHYRGIERVRREQSARFGERRLVFCGDYLVAPHLEGAAVAGTRAAEEVLAATRSL